MIILDLPTTEEKIFRDANVRKLLPHFSSLFDSWILAQRVSGLRQLGKRAILDFINSLEDTDLAIISRHFGEEVRAEELDYRIVAEIKSNLEEIESVLLGGRWYPNFCVSRDDRAVEICFWR